MRYLTAVVLLAVTLTACGDDGPSKENQEAAGSFCADYMGLDKYDNPEGFDRCVDDVIPVLNCLDPSKSARTPWIPDDCKDGGYDPD